MEIAVGTPDIEDGAKGTWILRKRVDTKRNAVNDRNVSRSHTLDLFV
jgi:hypothetical protein